jgi:TRAP-type C4-dicarboxylate transport system substrate-binding protein
VFGFLAAVAVASAQTTVLRMGTLAPKDSPWHKILLNMGEEWKKSSGGKIELKVYPGGEQGDEPAMVEKLRIKKLQLVAISGAGLSGIDAGVSALQIPMMLNSYEELDYVRERISDRLEKSLAQRGFVVLNWADAGWIYFFTKKPTMTPNEMRQLRLCTLQGDSGFYELYKRNGFHPVALAATDILTGLQTGLIDAFQSPPLVALSSQWFGGAKNMLDIKFAQLVGATVVSKDVWEKVPPATRTEMMKSAREAGVKLRDEIRKAESASIPLMQQFGLNVVHANDKAVAEWRTLAESTYPTLRGGEIPVDLFDQVKKLRDEYRKAHPVRASAAGLP